MSRSIGLNEFSFSEMIIIHLFSAVLLSRPQSSSLCIFLFSINCKKCTSAATRHIVQADDERNEKLHDIAFNFVDPFTATPKFVSFCDVLMVCIVSKGKILFSDRCSQICPLASPRRGFLTGLIGKTWLFATVRGTNEIAAFETRGVRAALSRTGT